jgi:hypothetical protein
MIYDIYEKDGEEEDGKLPTAPAEVVVVAAAAAVLVPSKEICKMDTLCASLGEKHQNSKHRRKRRRSSRFSFKSPTRNFQSMFFPDLVCGK